MTRHTIQGADNWQQRKPMSEARCQQVHGKLISLADQAKEIGEPSWLYGSTLLLSVLIIVIIFIAGVQL